LIFNDIEGAHYVAWPLGHAKLETTALYTRVATNIIREVMSPLDRLTPLKPKGDEPPA
jgi:integrase/recombinase XerD